MQDKGTGREVPRLELGSVKRFGSFEKVHHGSLIFVFSRVEAFKTHEFLAQRVDIDHRRNLMGSAVKCQSITPDRSTVRDCVLAHLRAEGPKSLEVPTMLEAHIHAAPATTERTLEALFRRIARIPKLHARFLNTIAMLEYIGARKIMKSQRSDLFDMELLSHVSEETRHAWLVKRMAVKIDAEAAATWSDEHTLCRREAERYIQTLDRAAEDELKSCGDFASFQQNGVGSHVNYLYTSLLIEERADVFYGTYVKVLEEYSMAGTLKAIIKDESKHLAQMVENLLTQDPMAEQRLPGLREIEQKAFAQFESALWQEVDVDQ